jgi:hypothetical protein
MTTMSPPLQVWVSSINEPEVSSIDYTRPSVWETNMPTAGDRSAVSAIALKYRQGDVGSPIHQHPHSAHPEHRPSARIRPIRPAHSSLATFEGCDHPALIASKSALIATDQAHGQRAQGHLTPPIPYQPAPQCWQVPATGVLTPPKRCPTACYQSLTEVS